MALPDRDTEKFDQIVSHACSDWTPPKFPDPPSRKLWLTVTVLGMVALVGGAIVNSPWLGVLGFMVALSGVAKVSRSTLQRRRRSPSKEPKANRSSTPWWFHLGNPYSNDK